MITPQGQEVTKEPQLKQAEHTQLDAMVMSPGETVICSVMSDFCDPMTMGSNPRPLHCGKILYHLSHQGSPSLLGRLVTHQNI